MNKEELCEQLNLSPHAVPTEIVEAFEHECEACRQTIAQSPEKHERRSAKAQLKQWEELGSAIRRVQARANVEEQLSAVEEVLRSGVGSPAPYFEEIDRWLPDCGDHSLELKVRSLRASAAPAKAEPSPPAPAKAEPPPPPPPQKKESAVSRAAVSEAETLVGGEVFQLQLDEAETLLSVGSRLLFGRERKGECDIGLPVHGGDLSPEETHKQQRAVSRKHFQVERQDPHVVLLDGHMDAAGNQKPSTGGLFVDGRKVTNCRLDLAKKGLLSLINGEVRPTRPAFRWRWINRAKAPKEIAAEGTAFGRSLLLERADGYRQRVLFLWDLLAGEEIRPELAGLFLVPERGGFRLYRDGEGLIPADRACKDYRITPLAAGTKEGSAAS